MCLEATTTTVDPSKYFVTFLAHEWFSSASEGYKPFPIPPVFQDFQFPFLSSFN